MDIIQSIIETFAFLAIGFSVFSSALLLLAYFFVYPFSEHRVLAKAACLTLLLGLIAIQLLQLHFLRQGGDLFASRLFTTLLLLVPVAFYLLSREVLQFVPPTRPILLVHGLPLAISPLFAPASLLPIPFLIGVGYALWLTVQVVRLRGTHQRGKVEFAVYGVFLMMAIGMLGLTFLPAVVTQTTVVSIYASLIGLGFALALFALLKFPDLIANTTEAVRAAYAASTLNKIDCDAVMQQLAELMNTEKCYTDETLSLSGVATVLGLSAHQLSELINTRFGINFSRYIREQRVRAAQFMLIDEAHASVLSIGLSVGFTSQSNFYAAFKEITGLTPGQYRKQQDTSDNPHPAPTETAK